MKFVLGDQIPTQFRKCQLNFDTTELNQGKKKLTDIFSQSTDFQQKNQLKQMLTIKKEEMNRQNLQNNENENQIFQKHHQKFFGKMVVYPIKIGPIENNKETDMDKQRKKALKLKQMHENIAKEVYISNEQQTDDLQAQMFDYFLLMGSDSGQTGVQFKPPELLQPKMTRSKSQKLDRIEQESCMIQRRLVPGLTLRENNRLKFTDKKEGNTLVLGQSIFEFAEQQTKDGIEMSKALKTHSKVYNRAQNRRYVTVDQSRGRIGEMSSQYPPMFQKAKFTKNLYFATNYQKQYTEQKQYQKPGLRLRAMDFRKNKVPLV